METNMTRDAPEQRKRTRQETRPNGKIRAEKCIFFCAAMFFSVGLCFFLFGQDKYDFGQVK